MTEKQIADALRAHLAGTPDAAPILWENSPGVWESTEYNPSPNPPFWRVSMVKAPPERQGQGNFHFLRGRLVVSVMAKEGDSDGFADTAETHAERIVARFEPDQDITAGDGVVTIQDQPYHDEGYADGAFWRVNVHIRWTAIKA